LLLEAVEELRTSLEELQVANEELRSQTEELDAARVLIERERLRYRDLFFALPDAYLVTDHHGVIQEANPQAGTLLGLPPAALRGRPLTLHLTASQRRAFRAELVTLRQTTTVQYLVLQLRRRDEIETEVTASVRALARPGRQPELCWTLRKVSPQQEYARQLHDLEAEFVRVQVVPDEGAGARSADGGVGNVWVYPENWPQLRIEFLPGGLQLAGEADLHTAPLLSKALSTIRPDRNGDFVVDLVELRFIDVATAELLIEAAEQLSPSGTLRLVYPQRAVSRVLHLLRLNELSNVDIVHVQSQPVISLP
jgi:anti-anti-sigma factor